MSAGNYPIRFAQEAHSYGTPKAEGDPTDVYAAVVYLWGGYSADRIGQRTQNLGADQAGGSVTIQIQNYPAVAPLDKLTDPQSGEVWEVESVVRGKNELVIQAVKGAAALRA